MKPVTLLLTILFCSVYAFGSDSVKTFSARQLMEAVRLYHPVAKMAETAVRYSEAEITVARGGFDPVLQYKAGKKTFDNQNYYRETIREIKIPTWYGIEISAGTINLSGGRINPEETPGSTSFAGISIPLARNLIIDKRRAALQQSKIMNQLALSEQQSAINTLYYEALSAYWHWVLCWQLHQVAGETVLVNEKRLNWVKKAWQQGERPAIDTVEAFVQWQSFVFLRNETQLAVQNAGLALSAYLWKPGNLPFNLPAEVQPVENIFKTEADERVPVLQRLLDDALNRHPDLQQYTRKLQYLHVEKKLKFQELLPMVNVQYNQLGKGYNIAKTTASWPLFENNFRYGISVAVPLRLSQGRGEYRKAKLNIFETELARSYKELQVTNKIKATYNELLNLMGQVALQESLNQNYRRLLSGEETRFFNGESSLFLVNTREQKLLEARQKLLEVMVKKQKTLMTLYWAAGVLAEEAGRK